DGLAQGYGEGTRHGPFSIGDSERGTGPQCMPVSAQRQNFIARFHGTTSLRVTPSAPRGSGLVPAYRLDGANRLRSSASYHRASWASSWTKAVPMPVRSI